MNHKNLDPVKCFVYGKNLRYNVQLKINGVIIGEGYVGDMKIFDTDNPLKAEIEELPSFVQEQMAFILKEGENTIELKFQHDSKYALTNKKFSFALVRAGFDTPLYYFSSEKESGSVTSKFYVGNENQNSENNLVSLGNTDASFIFSQEASFLQVILNKENVMVYGNSVGLTDLNLVEGSNTLEVKYANNKEGEITYYIQTPNFTKKVTKNITKDQLNKDIVDVYTF
ncbi:hypothetical protein [uncultured Formosa sp.]|uniref:hypothetical protein n=1 Tax=uncultured Formosa sp. TaxID=255435 RepID=UPI002614E481|nr:hypothetical protein [uncultured Formosa sp.]